MPRILVENLSEALITVETKVHELDEQAASLANDEKK